MKKIFFNSLTLIVILLLSVLMNLNPVMGYGKLNSMNSNLVQSDYMDKVDGVYRVIDVYPSGKRVTRGEFPFGVPASPKETGTSPIGEYLWLSGYQYVFTYLGRITGGTEFDGYTNMLLVLSNNTLSGNIDVKDRWDYRLGDASFVDTIDYGSDGYEDLILPDRTNNIPFVYNISSKQVIYSFSQQLIDFSVLDLKAGNFDGDFSKEIVVIGKDSLDSVLLYLFDDWSNNFLKLSELDITNFISDYSMSIYQDKSISSIRIALDDVDSDGAEEILIGFIGFTDITFKVVVGIFDYVNGNLRLLASTSLSQDSPSTQDNVRRDIIADDFDRDNNTEVVFASAKLYYFRYNKTSGEVNFITTLNIDGREFEYSGDIDLYYGDADTDYRDELVIAFNQRSLLRIYITKLGLDGSVNYFKIDYTLSSSDVRLSMIVGEFDNDGLNEISVSCSGFTDTGVYIFDDVRKNFELKGSKTFEVTTARKPITIPISVSGRILVKYTGFYNVSTSQPYIIAVMAAPPTIKGIDQNYDDTSTLFGTAVTKTTSETNGYSISTTVTLSYDSGDLFKVVNIHASMSFMYELEKSRTIAYTITECREFAGDYSNDYVIFETVLYDNYYYEVLVHPDSRFIGEKIAISIPNTPTVYKWTVEYFNENNGGYPDIGSETFNHTIGQVWTYPTKEYVDLMQQKYSETGFWKSSDSIAVGSGSGVNSIEIDLAREETTEVSTTIGVEFEAGFSVVGIGLSVSVGVGSSYIYSITIGEETKYRGDIGDIEPSFYKTYKYSVGLFVYNLYREADGLAYQVVNYWVENYKGPKQISGLDQVVASLPFLTKFVSPISQATGLSPGESLIVLIGISLVSALFFRYTLKKILGGKKRRKRRK